MGSVAIPKHVHSLPLLSFTNLNSNSYTPDDMGTSMCTQPLLTPSLCTTEPPDSRRYRNPLRSLKCSENTGWTAFWPAATAVLLPKMCTSSSTHSTSVRRRGASASASASAAAAAAAAASPPAGASTGKPSATHGSRDRDTPAAASCIHPNVVFMADSVAATTAVDDAASDPLMAFWRYSRSNAMSTPCCATRDRTSLISSMDAASNALTSTHLSYAPHRVRMSIRVLSSLALCRPVMRVSAENDATNVRARDVRTCASTAMVVVTTPSSSVVTRDVMRDKCALAALSSPFTASSHNLSNARAANRATATRAALLTALIPNAAAVAPALPSFSSSSPSPSSSSSSSPPSPSWSPSASLSNSESSSSSSSSSSSPPPAPAAAPAPAPAAPGFCFSNGTNDTNVANAATVAALWSGNACSSNMSSWLNDTSSRHANSSANAPSNAACMVEFMMACTGPSLSWLWRSSALRTPMHTAMAPLRSNAALALRMSTPHMSDRRPTDPINRNPCSRTKTSADRSARNTSPSFTNASSAAAVKRLTDAASRGNAATAPDANIGSTDGCSSPPAAPAAPDPAPDPDPAAPAFFRFEVAATASSMSKQANSVSTTALCCTGTINASSCADATAWRANVATVRDANPANKRRPKLGNTTAVPCATVTGGAGKPTDSNFTVADVP